MRKFTLILILSFFVTISNAQKKQAYQLYNSKGQKVTYKHMLKKLSKSTVVLFGEYHDNPISHWLEYEVTNDLSKKRSLIMGAEMFEADNQTPLSQYLKNEIDQTSFDSLARLWNNYKTDYKPLVDFAKQKNIHFIATNIPRRYASDVYRGGFHALDTLSSEEKLTIAPLPIKYDANLPSYVNMLKMMGGHGGPNLPKAQAIKDATMAYFIFKNLEPNKLFVHFNGSYHSDNFEGIYWYLKQEDSNLKIQTITTVEQDNIQKLESKNKKKANFIIAVPSTMTKTY